MQDFRNNYFELVKTNKMKDKELRRVYHDNIAMAFKDNYSWYKKETGKRSMNNEDIHIISNNAAEYFLKLLLNELKFPKGR